MSINKKDDLPTFEGNQMPTNVSYGNIEDDIGEETTRRVGGNTTSFAPIAILVPPESENTAISTKQIALTNETKSIVTAKPRIEVTKKSGTTESAWKLKHAPFVPPFGHPLEPTATFISYTNASTIAQRVSKILQERNIQATYKKSRAKCLTLDNVEFNVFLYQGKNEYSHGIILEIQRWSGNSAAFYEDTKAILDGANDDNTTTKETEGTPTMDGTISVFDDSLIFSLNMLQGNIDSQFLGLQILSSITDSNKMGTKTAATVCQKLTTSDRKVLNEVFGIVAKSEESSLVLQAIILLSNITNFETLPTEKVRKTLVSYIASDKPQVAYLAAKCFAPHQIDSITMDALKNAEKLGDEKQHSGLYALTNSLLQRYT